MRKKQEQFDNFWPGNRVENLSFELSGGQPIRIINSRWSDKKNFWYDMHYSLELGILLSGKMSRHYRDAQIDLVPGNIWFCNMWEPHGFKIIQAPCEIVFFMIFPPMLAKMYFEESSETNWLAPFYTSPGNRPQITSSENQNRILSAGKDLKNFLGGSEQISPVWLRLKLLEILLMINDQTQHVRIPNKLPSDSFDRISRSIQMVFESKKSVTTQLAARECGMNRNAFSSLFLRIMGIRYSKFGLLYRLNTVAEDLCKTTTPIKAIAVHWGFADACYLHHCFERYYKCSPAKYRKKARKML